MIVGILVYMENELTVRYLEALREVSVAEAARVTGRGRSTLEAYKKGTRRVTEAAARELLSYLRERAAGLASAADALEAALKEGGNG